MPLLKTNLYYHTSGCCYQCLYPHHYVRIQRGIPHVNQICGIIILPYNCTHLVKSDVCIIMKIWRRYQFVMSHTFWNTIKCYRYVKSMPLIFSNAFNAIESQLWYFSYLDKDNSDLINLTTKDGYVYHMCKCVYLGTTICTQLYRDHVIYAVNELYKRTNYLLIVVLYPLINRCQIWCFNNKKHWNVIHVVWRKCRRCIWKLNSKTHNVKLYYITLY